MIDFLSFLLTLPLPFQIALGGLGVALVIATYKLLPFT